MRHLSVLLLGALAACAATDPSRPPATPAPTSGAPAAAPTSEPPAAVPARHDAPASLEAYAAPAPDDVAALVGHQRGFTASIYRELAATPGNFALSPASISLAFAMTYAGARSETAAEMAAALHYRQDHPTLHRAFGSLIRRWNGDGGSRPYELAIANRLFGQASFPFRKEFVATTADHYQAALETLDFIGATEASRVHINDWVAGQTKDRIEDLLPEGSLTQETRLVLTNAVYFKGKWKTQFPKTATSDQPFHAAGVASPVPMMHVTSHFGYAETSAEQVLDLPYEGGDLAMTVVLPTDRDGLADLEERITAQSLAAWTGSLRPEKVIVSLPRFKIDPPESTSLKEPLIKLGMGKAFDPAQADFRAMAELRSNENLYIQDAFHKAFVEVNEEGTEAAAATGVVIGLRTSSVAPPPPPPKVFNADHPYLFLIRDTKTGAILFLGRVVEPAA